MTNARRIHFSLFALFAVLFFPVKVLALTDAHIAFHNSGQSSNVISNEYFIDKDSMTVQQIQSFLDSNNSYLKGFSENGRSAAQIIWDAAHGKYEATGTLNGITVNESTGTVSPKVILVYLQKEQSLISRTTYQEWAMIASMGYFCYAGVTGDNNGNNCKDIYEGFTKQVENGAWQLRYNYERASGTGFSDYQVGQNFNTSDGFTVNIATRATSSVYRYTPYIYYSAYNVWNLFYNLYDFDQGSGVPAPQEPPEANDIAAISLKTYSGTYSYTGIKTSACQAYYNDVLIAGFDAYTWSISLNQEVGSGSYAVIFKDADGAEVNRKTFSITRHKAADIDGNGAVDITDLAIFAENWGKSGPSEPMADMDGNNVVDITDFAIFAENWGQ